MKTTIRRMADANPVPDAGQLHPDTADVERLFSSIERRRDEMIGTTTRPSPGPVRPPQWRPWYRRPAVVFLFGVAVVLLVAAPLLLLGGGDADVAESTVASTTTVRETTTGPEATSLAMVERIAPLPDERGAFTRVVATGEGYLAVAGLGDGPIGEILPGQALWHSTDGSDWAPLGDPADPVGLGFEVDILDLAVNDGGLGAVVQYGCVGIDGGECFERRGESEGLQMYSGVATSSGDGTWAYEPLSEFSWLDADATYALEIEPFGEVGFVVSGTAVWLSQDGETFEQVFEGVPIEYGPEELENPEDLPPSRLRLDQLATKGTAAIGTQELSSSVVYSPDGRSWETLSLAATDPAGGECWPSILDVAFGPQALAVGSCFSPGTDTTFAAIWVSADGRTWTQRPYDPGAFGDGTSPGERVRTWFRAATGDTAGYATGGFAVAGRTGSASVWVSDDASTWRQTALEDQIESTVYDLVIDGDVIITVGQVEYEPAIWIVRSAR